MKRRKFIAPDATKLEALLGMSELEAFASQVWQNEMGQHIPGPSIELTSSSTSRALVSNDLARVRKIRMSEWVFEPRRHPQYRYLVLAHELAHHLVGFEENHSTKFKKCEAALCKRYCDGIEPLFVLNRVYPVAYIRNGEIVCDFSGFPPFSSDGWTRLLSTPLN
jgi:hypothetical protein